MSTRGSRVIIVGNGRPPSAAGLAAAAAAAHRTTVTADPVDLVIAVDGGAATALALGLRPDLVLGDGDSLDASTRERLERDGIPVELVAAEKDESDMELAVRHAASAGAGEVLILGALGGRRIEHTLANIALLGLAELEGVDVALVDDRSQLRLLRADAAAATLVVHGEPGDFVSLFPWRGDAQGVTTDGLRYPLRDEPLLDGPSRGLSNELVGDRATVRVARGRLLVVHTRRGTSGHDSPSASGGSRDDD